MLGCAIAAGCSTAGRQRTSAPPSPADVVAMSRAGVAPDEIIQRMQESNAVYPLTDAQLDALRSEGVSEHVINYMRRSYVAQGRLPAYGTREYYELYRPGSMQPPVYGFPSTGR
jgi:hypothetical protein